MLYFISDGARIKIGHSQSPFDRARELQIGNAKSLTVLLTLDIENAKQIEFMMHERLVHYRLEGEWFSIPFSRAFEGLLELRSLMHFPGQAELALSSPPEPKLSDCIDEFRQFVLERNPNWNEVTHPLTYLWSNYRRDFFEAKK